MSSYDNLKKSHKYDEVINKHRSNYHIDFPHMDTVLNKPPGIPE